MITLKVRTCYLDYIKNTKLSKFHQIDGIINRQRRGDFEASVFAGIMSVRSEIDECAQRNPPHKFRRFSIVNIYLNHGVYAICVGN